MGEKMAGVTQKSKMPTRKLTLGQAVTYIATTAAMYFVEDGMLALSIGTVAGAGVGYLVKDLPNT